VVAEPQLADPPLLRAPLRHGPAPAA
jgi:hypothetical protein